MKLGEHGKSMFTYSKAAMERAMAKEITWLAGSRKNGGATGCGKDARRKSPKADFSTLLGNPVNRAGFPLSHSPGDDGIIPCAAEKIQNDTPSANL